MIDWNKSAELNNTTIEKLQKRFEKFPKSNKLIVKVCDNCRKVKEIKLCDYRDLCHKCGNNTIVHCEKISKYHKNKQKWVGENNPHYKGKIILICKQCGKDYEIAPSRKNTSNFCSNKCHGEWESINKSGKNASNWQGGISFEIYPEDFNNQFKKLIRSKYNNCDYISGLYKNICNMMNDKICELDIHHIDYNKRNNNISNFIPLSRSNHTKTGSYRFFWNRLFKYSLEIDKWYYGDDLNDSTSLSWNEKTFFATFTHVGW